MRTAAKVGQPGCPAYRSARCKVWAPGHYEPDPNAAGYYSDTYGSDYYDNPSYDSSYYESWYEIGCGEQILRATWRSGSEMPAPTPATMSTRRSRRETRR